VLEKSVESIMTSDVHSCDPHDTVDSLMHLMTEQRIRHVPVVVEGKLAGIISIGDVVKSRIGELEFERDQLTSYVTHTQ
jgi:CBS domain-containing protein